MCLLINLFADTIHCVSAMNIGRLKPCVNICWRFNLSGERKKSTSETTPLLEKHVSKWDLKVSRVTEIWRTGITYWDDSRYLEVKAFHFAQLETFHVRTNLLNVQIVRLYVKREDLRARTSQELSQILYLHVWGGYWEYTDFKWCDQSKSGSLLAVRNELEIFSYKTSVVEVIFMIPKETVYWMLTQPHICWLKLPYKMEAE